MTDETAITIIVAATFGAVGLTLHGLVYAVRDLKARIQEINYELSGISRAQAELELEMKRIVEQDQNRTFKKIEP